MGCDIHVYREKLVNADWVSADQWTEDDGCWSHDEIGGNRNYTLFSILADVRSNEPPCIGFKPKGVPLRLSPEVARECDAWEGDGHSHSHLYLFELEELLTLSFAATQKISGVKERTGLAKLYNSIQSGEPDWTLLYPYAKWCSNMTDYEQFTVDVPLHFLCGQQLQEIIDGLKGVGGDMQRIVFWFDN